MGYDVLVVGRPQCDLIFTGLPSWPLVGREVLARDLVVTAGGAFNVVAALHRLGLRVGMIGRVGDDAWSRLAMETMAAEGVATDLIDVVDRPLPSVSVCVTHEGDRGFLTYEPADPAESDAVRAYALAVLARERAPYLLSYLGPSFPAYAEAGHAHGMTLVVDCGWDEAWLSSQQVRALLPLIDLLFASEPEACCIAGVSDPLAALRRLGELARFVVVKRGRDGASAIVERREYHVPTEPVDVVDATGAGDCFNAGFLYGLRQGRTVEECLRLGNIGGGMSVAKPGGFCGAPTEPELIAKARQLGMAIAPWRSDA